MSEKLNEVVLREGVTDYLAVNSPRVAKIMKSSRKVAVDAKEFRGGTAKLGKLGRLLWFMTRSVIWRMPLKKTEGDVVKFKKPSRVIIQAEGESQELVDVEKIEIKKAGRPLKVVKM